MRAAELRVRVTGTQRVRTRGAPQSTRASLRSAPCRSWVCGELGPGENWSLGVRLMEPGGGRPEGRVTSSVLPRAQPRRLALGRTWGDLSVGSPIVPTFILELEREPFTGLHVRPTVLGMNPKGVERPQLERLSPEREAHVCAARIAQSGLPRAVGLLADKEGVQVSRTRKGSWGARVVRTQTHCFPESDFLSGRNTSLGWPGALHPEPALPASPGPHAA